MITGVTTATAPAVTPIDVQQVERDAEVMIVTVSTPPQPTGCPSCGVIATGRGRRPRVLHDVPGVTRVRVLWRQRVWRCDDADCAKKTFVEQVPTLVTSRGSITHRAIRWSIVQLRREHATIQGLARQLGTSWKTVWRAVKPGSFGRYRVLDLADLDIIITDTGLSDATATGIEERGVSVVRAGGTPESD